MLLILIVVLGPLLLPIPLGAVELASGALLLLFGMRWLRKAILRIAGIIPLHDEEALYKSQREALEGFSEQAHGWDALTVSAAFKITMIKRVVPHEILRFAKSRTSRCTKWGVPHSV